MQKANISELKNRLSAYLRRVRAGETVLIMERNRPIARIERVPAGDERLAKLEAEGLVRRPLKPLPPGFLDEELPKPQGSVLEALLEERAEGW